jgi:hypothetical protein
VQRLSVGLSGKATGAPTDMDAAPINYWKLICLQLHRLQCDIRLSKQYGTGIGKQ